jgi:diaminohydroxyphosphoribosylaminopyrimidine deaminase/5-amino-6-(5-phosphoribosylamino)uracil reductase
LAPPVSLVDCGFGGGSAVGLRSPSEARDDADSRLRTPPAAKTLGLDGDVLVFCTRDAESSARRPPLERAGARVEALTGGPRLELAAVMARLAAHEINSVWLEAGPTLSGAMLEAGLVDELVLYFAPCLLGDAARGLFSLPAFASLDERIRLVIDDRRPVGDDLRIIARPVQD